MFVTMYIYIYIYHHTVQVAMCAYSFVRTLVNVLVLQGKTPPAQVAAGDDDHDCKWSIFAGSTRARSALRWCPCASCIWLLHPAPILVPKMVLTLCNLRWWCFSFHQLAKILHLQSWSSSPAATCAGGVFPWSTSTFTNVRTNE